MLLVVDCLRHTLENDSPSLLLFISGLCNYVIEDLANCCGSSF